MKPGYSLIELTIGILLASMLAISLFQSVRNTTYTVELADDIMDLDVRVSNFHHQFERDTIGIFMPAFAAVASGETEKKEALPQSDKQTPGRAKPEEKGKEELKPQKAPDKLFYSVNGDTGQVTEFTFITSNPLRVYEKAANVTVKPRMVRVMYRLIVDPKDETSFTLLRQETDELDIQAVDPKAAKPVRGYTLLNNIKKMSFDFSYPVKKEQEKQSAPLPDSKSEQVAKQTTKPTQAEPEIEKIESRSDWPFKTAEEAKEKKVPEIPQFITAKFELWDATKKSFREFTLTYPIASFTLLEKKRKKQAQKPAVKAPSTEAKTNKRVELNMTFRPKTEARLKELGEKVFKVTLPDADLSVLQKSNMFLSKEERAKKVKGVS